MRRGEKDNDSTPPTTVKAGRDDLDRYRLEENPGYLIRRMQQRAVEIFDQEVGSLGVTPQQFATLRVIAARPGLSQIDIVEELGIDRSTTTELVGRLVERGLVKMKRSGGDRRSTSLFLSSAGEALLLAALPGVLRTQERIMAPIPQRRRLSVLRNMAQLAGLDVTRFLTLATAVEPNGAGKDATAGAEISAD